MTKISVVQNIARENVQIIEHEVKIMVETKGVDVFISRLNLARGSESISSLAKRSGIKKGTLNNYANGDTPVTLPALRKLSSALEKPISWLVGEKTEHGNISQVATGSGNNQVGRDNNAGTMATGGSSLNNGLELSAKEQQLISLIRDINQDGPIDKYITELTEYKKHLEEASKKFGF